MPSIAEGQRRSEHSCASHRCAQKRRTSERTGEARLELFVHHRVDNALDVSWVRVPCAVVDSLLVDDIVRRMAGLAVVRTDTLS